MSDPDFDLDDYVNQIENAIHAAYEAGHPHSEIYGRIESLLYRLNSDHEPRIDTPDAFEAELEALTQSAYIETSDVIRVLDEKRAELESIGANAPEEGDALPAESDEATDPDG
jgi:hypothetical protein